MKAICVDITRWVDNYQPGIVECRFLDVHGTEHTFIEKLPLVTEADLDAESEYPQPGLIACEPQKIYRDAEGRIVAKVSTAEPWHIESVEGLTTFEVAVDGLSSIDWHLPRTYRDGNDATLPTDEQKEHLCVLMHYAFVEIRFGWDGTCEQTTALADAFHNLPREMYGWGSWSWKRLRNWLQRYQHKYRGSRSGIDYVGHLDDIRAGKTPNF